MNSKERVETALAHREPDRVPVGELGIDHDVVEKGLGRSVLWRNKAETTRMLWQGRRDELIEHFKRDLNDIVEHFDYDLVPVIPVPPAGLEEHSVKEIGPEQWQDEEGRVWRYSPGNDSMLLMQRPEISFSSEQDVEDYFDSVLVPRFGFTVKNKHNGQYSLEFTDESRLELIRFAKEEFGDSRFLFCRSFSYDNGNIEPMELSEFEVIGEFFGGTEEEVFIHTATHPALVKKAVDLYSQVHMAFTELLAEEGIDAVISSGDFSSEKGPMIAPGTIRKLFLPAMKKEVEHTHKHGMHAITHNCGNNWAVIDMLIEAGYDCMQSIQRSAGMGLKELKEEYGNDMCFWGGIEISSLHDDTFEQACRDTLYALKHAAPGGGFILGDCSTVSYGCSYVNYKAALDTAEEFGRYPISEGIDVP